MVHSLEDVTAVTSTIVRISSTFIQATWVRVRGPASVTAGTRVGDVNISATRGDLIITSGEVLLPPSGNTVQYNLMEIYIRGTSSEKFAITYGTV